MGREGGVLKYYSSIATPLSNMGNERKAEKKNRLVVFWPLRRTLRVD